MTKKIKIKAQLKPIDPIDVKLYRSQVEALLSCVKIDMPLAVNLDNLGYMKFSGNQHNPNWSWDFEQLKREYPSTRELYNLYLKLRVMKDSPIKSQ